MFSQQPEAGACVQRKSSRRFVERQKCAVAAVIGDESVNEEDRLVFQLQNIHSVLCLRTHRVYENKSYSERSQGILQPKEREQQRGL